MKNKIIFFPYIILLFLAMFIYVVSIKLDNANKTINNLTKENRVFERQIEFSNKDLFKYQEELKNNEKIIRTQQKKIQQSKSSNCLDEPIPDDVLNVLCETGFMFDECPNT